MECPHSHREVTQVHQISLFPWPAGDPKTLVSGRGDDTWEGRGEPTWGPVTVLTVLFGLRRALLSVYVLGGILASIRSTISLNL